MFLLFRSRERMKVVHPKESNTVSFLATKITWEVNYFSTLIYRKPTFIGVFTNFKSSIPCLCKSF